MSLLSNMRQSYEQGSLEEENAANVPLLQFQAWFAEALSKQVAEPNAMTLATVGSGGRPSTRIVLVKDVDERGLVWYTNYESRKAQELAENAQAALQFHWVTLERVVRIEGRVEKVSAEESDAYYASRPLDSRLGAWASPQSQVIPNRGVLVANAAKVALTHGLHPQRPPHWGGFRLVPDTWEFWAGRPSRLHDRLRYRLQDGAWLRERLAP